jgi:hypothetical protein
LFAAANACHRAVFVVLNDANRKTWRLSSSNVFHQQGGWAMRASLMALIGATGVLAATATGASAQVLNLTGQFQCVRMCSSPVPALASLNQINWDMSLVNDAGFPSHGWIDYPGHIWIATWNEGAVYSPDGLTIQFDNGTVWRRVVAVPVVAPFGPPIAPPVFRHYRHYRPIAANG